MAIFEPSYAITQKNEGGYVNDTKDKGGETYRGIARKIWASWKGWALIDIWKVGLLRLPKTNEFVAASFVHSSTIDRLVRDFYFAQWTASMAGSINDQALANAYYDLYVLSGQAVTTLQKALKSIGHAVSIDNKIGSQTISLVNKSDSELLLKAFTAQRIEFHQEMVKKGYVNEKYLNGWIKRAEQFMQFATKEQKVIGLGAIMVMIGIFFAFKKSISKQLTTH
jgi:lysozyme family protein